MSQENVELAQQVFDAFNRRDLRAFLALMDAGVEAGSRLAAMEGGYHGHDGIRQWWQNLLGAIPDYTLETVEAREPGNQRSQRCALAVTGRTATPRSRIRCGSLPTGVTRKSSGGVSCRLKPKPSKPWGCRSSPLDEKRKRLSRVRPASRLRRAGQ
jgi:hypothetical protein